MIGKLSNVMQSNKVRGILWVVAVLPMIVGPMVFDGNKGVIGIGVMFLIFGMMVFRNG